MSTVGIGKTKKNRTMEKMLVAAGNMAATDGNS
jgi:hypothetical protein